VRALSRGFGNVDRASAAAADGACAHAAPTHTILLTRIRHQHLRPHHKNPTPKTVHLVGEYADSANDRPLIDDIQLLGGLLDDCLRSEIREEVRFVCGACVCVVCVYARGVCLGPVFVACFLWRASWRAHLAAS
jgi:hypothetical protein